MGRHARKSDWQKDGLYTYVEHFIDVMRMEQEAQLTKVLAALKRGTAGRLNLDLAPAEVQAFLDLTEALRKGWSTGQDLIMGKYSELVSRGHKAEEDNLTIEQAWEMDGAMMKTPDELLDIYTKRELKLAGIFEDARLEKTRQLISDTTSEGLSYEAQANRLREEFPTFLDHRLRNIARTEGAYLHEHGEFARTAMSLLVVGWEFDAVMDSSTSLMCRERHGKIFMREDSALDIPPLHFQCRSEQLPLFVGENLEADMMARDAEFEQEPLKTFGEPPSWVDWKSVKPITLD